MPQAIAPQNEENAVAKVAAEDDAASSHALHKLGVCFVAIIATLVSAFLQDHGFDFDNEDCQVYRGVTNTLITVCTILAAWIPYHVAYPEMHTHRQFWDSVYFSSLSPRLGIHGKCHGTARPH